jgi:sugar-specific transcriptional regulator TrmB
MLWIKGDTLQKTAEEMARISGVERSRVYRYLEAMGQKRVL